MQWWKRIDQAGGTALHRDVLFDRPRFADRHPPVRSPRDPLPPAQGVSRVCQDSGRPRLHPHLALPPHPRFDGDRSLEVSTLLQRPRPNNGLRHVQEPSGIFHSLLGNTSFGLTLPNFRFKLLVSWVVVIAILWFWLMWQRLIYCCVWTSWSYVSAWYFYRRWYFQTQLRPILNLHFFFKSPKWLFF